MTQTLKLGGIVQAIGDLFSAYLHAGPVGLLALLIAAWIVTRVVRLLLWLTRRW